MGFAQAQSISILAHASPASWSSTLGGTERHITPRDTASSALLQGRHVQSDVTLRVT